MSGVWRGSAVQEMDKIEREREKVAQIERQSCIEGSLKSTINVIEHVSCSVEVCVCVCVC